MLKTQVQIELLLAGFHFLDKWFERLLLLIESKHGIELIFKTICGASIGASNDNDGQAVSAKLPECQRAIFDGMQTQVTIAIHEGLHCRCCNHYNQTIINPGDALFHAAVLFQNRAT